jgi:hypothetical protein
MAAEGSNNNTAAAGIRPPKALIIGEDGAYAWKLWEQQFNWFSISTQLDTKPEKVQAATLLATIGPDVIPIFNSFGLTEQEQEDVKVIRERFTNHFAPKIHLTYERYLFNKMVQEPGESFDEFLTKLRNQSKKCSFGELADDLLCDKIVVGIMNDTVREKLLSEEKLELEKTVKICKANELTTKQLMKMRGDNSDEQVINVVRTKKDSVKDEIDCNRCGKRHLYRKCEAFTKICEKCGFKGHLKEMCRARKKHPRFMKKVETVDVAASRDELASSDEELYINVLEKCEKGGDPDWFEMISVNGEKIRCKLDCGAQCNVISRELLRKLPDIRIIPSTTKNLVSFTEHKVEVIGETNIKCELNGRSTSINFKVINNGCPTILGKQTCIDEKLICRINEIEVDEEIFQGLGCLKNFEYDIDLKDGSQFTAHPPRRIPYKIRDEVKAELDRMEKMQVITKTTKPTPVVSPMVLVRKNGKLRICIDPTDVNNNLLRRHYPLKGIEEITATITNSKFFTILDCKKGFWQLKVSPRTSEYLTFGTPWGRYSFLRLAFGLASAPEIFQQIMSRLLQGVKNTEVSMDDILIHAGSKEELQQITQKVMHILKEAGLRLNREKCIFGVSQVKFLGHLLTNEGLKPDEGKVEAIQRLKIPTNVTELQRFLGMVNYLSKFTNGLSDLTQPLRCLLGKSVEFIWDENHTKAFEKIKQVIASPVVLAYYDVNEPVKITVDASSKAVGGALLQNERPVAYITKALTKTEQMYPQIEKEATAIRVACKKLHQYIYGKPLLVETDHKPLVTIFKKPIHTAPPRLQRILFDLQQYSPTVVYKKGKDLHLADALSRDCEPAENDLRAESDLEVHVITCVSKEFSAIVRKEITRCSELSQLTNMVMNGWPENVENVPEALRKYWSFKEEIASYDGLLFKGESLIIPVMLKMHVLKKIHSGHMGVQSCIKRAKGNVYWHGMYADITAYVEKCSICQGNVKDNPKEPMMMSEIPKLPWELVASDLFHFAGDDYLLIVDSYSGFYDFVKLNQTTSGEVINHLKKWFSVHGVPRNFYSDNGPQYSSRHFKSFAKDWGFEHKTSSPRHAQANGLAERYVQNAKNLLKKCCKDNTDIQLALLNVRNTPRSEMGSPVQRLMSRSTRNQLSSNQHQLEPVVKENVTAELSRLRQKQKYYADSKTVTRPTFKIGDNVAIQEKHREWYTGEIVENASTPRSFIVRTQDDKLLRRNSKHLRLAKVMIPRPKRTVVPEMTSQMAAPETTGETLRRSLLLEQNHYNGQNHDLAQQVCSDASSSNVGMNTEETSQGRVAEPYQTRSGRTVKPLKRMDL